MMDIYINVRARSSGVNKIKTLNNYIYIYKEIKTLNKYIFVHFYPLKIPIIITNMRHLWKTEASELKRQKLFNKL